MTLSPPGAVFGGEAHKVEELGRKVVEAETEVQEGAAKHEGFAAEMALQTRSVQEEHEIAIKRLENELRKTQEKANLSGDKVAELEHQIAQAESKAAALRAQNEAAEQKYATITEELELELAGADCRMAYD